MLSSTAICDEKMLKANEVLVIDDPMFARYGYKNQVSVQGFAEGGSVTVKVEYANHSRLAFNDHESITFADGTDQHKVLDQLPPCRHVRYIITNTAAVPVKFTLVPCYI